MKWVVTGGALICAAVFAFATSNKLRMQRYSISSDKLTRSFRAVHISDLHESCYGKGQSKLISAVKAAKPDVIFITGDMIEDDKRDVTKKNEFLADNNSRVALEALVEIAPCYMVLGNHEANVPNINELCVELQKMGVHLLQPHSREAILGDVIVCGVQDPYFLKAEAHHNNLAERFAEDKDRVSPTLTKWRELLSDEYADITEDERFTILLSHRPEEYELYRSLGFDAALSGHAHGGQWRLPPFINGVYAPNQGFFPNHAGGLYEYDGFAHVVSRGLSKKRMVRIFNRPEVCVVEFEADMASTKN